VTEELSQSAEPRVPRSPGLHVVVSELAVAVEGSAQLEAAFRHRLGEVDDFAGHVGLEVWKDERRPGRYLQVTWWESPDAFRSYMRSDAHRRSHARIPTDPVRPAGVHVDRFSLLSS
jgi:heme-degrading monooxygenase HmoA